MKKQSGFTLIELMIVVAIVGILAALALPAYQDYIARSRMAEVLAELAESKTSVSEYVASNGEWPADANQAGIGSASIYISAVAVAGSDTGGDATPGEYFDVVLTLTDRINPAVNGDTIRMRGTAIAGNELNWECQFSDATAYKYVPSNCRNAVT
jgi:type IV pilus assembly protein PilA